MENGHAAETSGPLSHLTIIEMAGLGPVPLAGLMLAELGASVLRIERPRSDRAFLLVAPEFDVDRLGRAVLTVDLKRPEGLALVLKLIDRADGLIEGFRPGVMERIGLGPDVALARNPGLVYGRMTGFGSDGPLASRAGHDLTYLAYSGLLHAIGPANGRPVPPLNLVADYGGGTMFLLLGMLSALIERGRSGIGQVVDAAMIDGASYLAAPIFSFLAGGIWKDLRGANLLDSGAPFYDTYETLDDRHVAVACLEPEFFAEFARLLPLDGRFTRTQHDTGCWDEMRAAIAKRFKEKSRDEWAALFEDTNACVAPVLSLMEAPHHRHNLARATHSVAAGFVRPAPAPRFSRTRTKMAGPASANLRAVLSEFGIGQNELEAAEAAGVVETTTNGGE